MKKFIGMRRKEDIFFVVVPPEMEEYIGHLAYVEVIGIMFSTEIDGIVHYSGMEYWNKFENVIAELCYDNEEEDFENPQAVKNSLKKLGEYFDTKVFFDGKPLK